MGDSTSSTASEDLRVAAGLRVLHRLPLERLDGGAELARQLPALRALPFLAVGLGQGVAPLLPGGAGLRAAAADLLPPELDLGGDLEGARGPAVEILGVLDGLGVGDGAVPLGGVLRRGPQRDVGAAADHGGPVGLARLAQGTVHVLRVVAVALEGGPAAGREPRHLVGCIGEAHGSVDGDAVVVEQDGELAQPLHPRESDGLVAHALHQAAVAGDHVGAVIDQILAPAGAQHLLRHGEAHGGGEALPERAGGGLDPGRVVDLRMTRGVGAPLAEVADLLHRHLRVAREIEQRVKQHGAMAGRQDEAVAVGPSRLRGVELEVARVKDRGDVGHAHGHPRMARIGGGHGVERQRADGGRSHPVVRVLAAEGLDVHGRGSSSAMARATIPAGRRPSRTRAPADADRRRPGGVRMEPALD